MTMVSPHAKHSPKRTARGHAYIQAEARLLSNHAERSRVRCGRRVREKPQANLGSEEASQPTGHSHRRHIREGSRGRLLDLIGSPQLAVLTFELLEPFALLAGQARALALIDLCEPQP